MSKGLLLALLVLLLSIVLLVPPPVGAVEEAGDGSDEAAENRSGHGWDWTWPWRRHQRHHHHHHRNGSSAEGMRNKTQTEEESRNNRYVVAKLSGGRVMGVVSHAAGADRPANVFKKIPMAEPPVGKLRFRPLQKKRPWGGVLNGTEYSPACLSNTTRTRSPQHYISEDCIYMNVFADPKCKLKACPVLFYVHGGGFAYDSATMFNDTQIVQKYASDGIVFLIPAYRLGVFGFLDLGSDRVVKRNLGLHDIIFALEWTHREVHAFGGDPDQITVMGNSAGASAVSYLCASPAVGEHQFRQAIISSGVPFFGPDANRNQSHALLQHFNCTRDKRTNRPLSDRERADCLRGVDSLELLREQQANEDRHILFSGPESDSELLPAKNFAGLLKYWKARPLLSSTTKHENARWPDDTLRDQCLEALTALGYASPQAFNACWARYNETFYEEENMRVSYESMHAESFLTSLVNTRMGGRSYVGEFEIQGYSNHADDLFFFFGLHNLPMNTSEQRLMDAYYPRMIKNFLHGKAPDIDWKPQQWNGRNYFRIAFNVSANDTVVEWPHGVDDYQDLPALDFWLREMAQVEEGARREQEKRREEEREEEIWRKIFGGNDSRRMVEKTAGPLSLMALPPPPNENSTSGAVDVHETNLPNASLLRGNGAKADGLEQMGPEETAEFTRVWSAFWLTLTVTMLLSIAILMMTITRVVYRYKNARGYSYNSPGDAFLSEKTRIVRAANGTSSMRYM